MDDQFELLGRQDPGDGAGRPWTLFTGILVVALLALVGVVWMVNATLDGGSRVRPAAAGPTTTSVAPPVPTTSEDFSIPTMASPTPSGQVPTVTTLPSVALPSVALPSVALPSIALPSAPPRSAVMPRPTPVPTTPRPVPPVTRVPPAVPVPGSLVRVPDVVGQPVKEAVEILTGAGFRVAVMGAGIAPPEERGNRPVVGQRPGAGALLPRGTVVMLITGSR